MKSTALIMLIASMLVAATAVGVIFEVTKAPSTTTSTDSIDGPKIIELGVWAVEDGEAKAVSVKIEGGEEPVVLNESFIEVSTSRSRVRSSFSSRN